MIELDTEYRLEGEKVHFIVQLPNGDRVFRTVDNTAFYIVDGGDRVVCVFTTASEEISFAEVY